MQDLLNLFVLLALLSCALSFILSPFMGGRVDPLFLVKKGVRAIVRVTLNMLNLFSRSLAKLAKAAQRQAKNPHTTRPLRIVYYGVWVICLLARVIAATPAGLIKTFR